MVNSPAHRNLLPLREEMQGEELVKKKSNLDELEEEEEQETEEDDNEEIEIRDIIRRSQQFLLPRTPKMRTAGLPKSCSAHANLGIQEQQRQGTAQGRREDDFERGQLETSPEEDEGKEKEDSDDELYAAHSSLLPLRKSKSAFAGFPHHSSSAAVKSNCTTPFACPVVVKKMEGTTNIAEGIKPVADEEDGPGIAELIDLSRGDVLKFRISHHHQKGNSPECVGSSSCSSSNSSLNRAGRTQSCWSAPACCEAEADDDEYCSTNAEEEEEDQGSGQSESEEWGNGRQLRGKRRRMMLTGGVDERKESSWSAPSRFSPICHLDEEQQEEEEEEEEEEEGETWLDEPADQLGKVANLLGECKKNQQQEVLLEKGQKEELSAEEEEEKWGVGEKEEEKDDCQLIEPQNMKNLELDEGQLEEQMSTEEDEEEEEENEAEGREEDKRPLKSPEFAYNCGGSKQMRVFVSTNNRMVSRSRRQFPSSQSDSQLLWHRYHAPSVPPPPPAPFPLTIDERGGQQAAAYGMPHSRTYGGIAERRQGMDEGGEGGEENRLDQREQNNMSFHQRQPMPQPLRFQVNTIAPNGRFNSAIRQPNSMVQFRHRPAGQLSPKMSATTNTGGEQQQDEGGKSEEIPMADDCPTPNLALLPGYQPPFGSTKRHSRRSATSSLAVDHCSSVCSSPYCSEEEQERKGFLIGAIQRQKLIVQRSAAACLCRRGSPPMAQSELMSESEISDLEQQIASGRLIKSYAGRPTHFCHFEVAEGEQTEEGDGRQQELCKLADGKEGPTVAADEQPSKKGQTAAEEYQQRNPSHPICTSSSMPALIGNDDPTRRCWWQTNAHYGEIDCRGGPGTVAADFWRSEYPVEEDDDNLTEEEEEANRHRHRQNMHRSLTLQNEFNGGRRNQPLWHGQRRRRILPSPPVGQQQQQQTNAAAAASVQPGREEAHLASPLYRRPSTLIADHYDRSHYQLTSTSPPAAVESPSALTAELNSPPLGRPPLSQQSSTTKRRQLPKTPPLTASVEDPLDQIDITTATKEYLLSVLQLAHQKQQQIGGKQKTANKMDEKEEGGKEEDDFCSPSVLPSPSTVVRQQRPVLPLSLAQNTHKWQQNDRHSQQQAKDEYKLSYGMDQSVLRQANRGMASIEGSYYYEEELDGLNGNSSPLLGGGGGRLFGKERRTAGWAESTTDELYTPDEEGERRRVSSGYNLADGAKSSSGISSSCTTSSRSYDQPENDFLGGSSRRQTLHGGRGGHARQRTAASTDPSVPTHRVQFPFVPRHSDEIRLERGDPLHVNQRFEDHWCHGLNLRTSQQGIFPEAHIVEIDLVDEICQSVLPEMSHKQNQQERDTFYLTLLASIEVAHHKGNDVLVQAINKVCSMYQRKEEILVPQTVLMEISFRGIHVIDKRKKDIFRCPTFDFFYSLQNISFCGAHPKELKYFGFITKHPLLPRFACHVFLSNDSTQPIVDAIGRAFKRSYDEYMAFAHPTEDIFIE